MALEEGRPVKVESQTVGQYLENWLGTQLLAVKDGTSRSYTWAVHTHLVPGLGPLNLQRLSAQDLQAFLDAKFAAGLSAKSVKLLRDAFRAALNKALKWGLVQRKIATLVTLPRVEKKEGRVWSASEANAFLASINGHRSEGIYYLALCFGARQGEILALTWDDIDFERGRFRIRATQQRINGTLTSAAPKTASSRRQAPMALGLGDLLAARKRAQNDERDWAAGQWEETGIVFTTSRGTRLDANNLRREYRALVKAAGLRYIPFHSLRSTAASLLKEHGLTDQEIATILGHSSTSTTKDFYLHATPDSEARTVQKLEETFSRVAVSVAVKSGKSRPN